MQNERIVISGYGPASVLQLVREPMPSPGPGEIRVKVEAAGVSFGGGAAEINKDLRELIGLLHAGSIAPRIGATFALQEAQRAHELLESENSIGKIVLIP